MIYKPNKDESVVSKDECGAHWSCGDVVRDAARQFPLAGALLGKEMEVTAKDHACASDALTTFQDFYLNYICQSH